MGAGTTEDAAHPRQSRTRRTKFDAVSSAQYQRSPVVRYPRRRDELLAPALAAGEQAASAAGVTVRELSSEDDLQEANAIPDGIWSPEQPGTMIRSGWPARCAMPTTTFTGAFDDHRLVGFPPAFFGRLETGEYYLRSHILGVRPDAQTRGGRSRPEVSSPCMGSARGTRLIQWTYDPLLRQLINLSTP